MLHLTVKDFEIEAKHSPRPVVVMFYAVWCGKCAMMKPVIEDIEKKYMQKVRFCEVDVDKSETLAAEYEADIVPTFVFFNGNKVVGVLQGIIDSNVFETRMKKIFHLE